MYSNLPMTNETKDTLKQMFLVDLKRVIANIESYMNDAKEDEMFFDIAELIEHMGRKLKEIDEKQNTST
jgi:hypothetical protein